MRFSIQEAWDRFPELRDRFNSIDELSAYRAVVLREADRPEAAVPHTERWLEGERGFLDSPEYDILVELPDSAPSNGGWRLLQTGGHIYVLVKDMELEGRGKAAVSVSDDAVVVHSVPYDDDWVFFDKEEEWWSLGDEKDVQKFLGSSEDVFTPEQQREILKAHNALLTEDISRVLKVLNARSVRGTETRKGG